MSRLLLGRLSRRERQIMEILFDRGEATVAEIQDALPDPPSYSAVRALLRILEEKGQAIHKEDGIRYVYSPAESWPAASRSAIEQVVQMFFAGSVEKAVATMLSSVQTRPDAEELERLEHMIQQARAECGMPSAGATQEGENR